MAGPLWRGGHGRRAFDPCRALCCAQPGASARLTERAEDWAWSSVRAHLAGTDDQLAIVAPLLERIGDFAAFLGSAEDQQATRALRMAETTGRPLGDPAWIGRIEQATGRALAPRKRGPRPRVAAEQIVSCF